MEKNSTAFGNALMQAKTDFEGVDRQDKLDCVLEATSFLAAIVGGYNACSACDSFGLGESLQLDENRMERIVDTTLIANKALAAVVGCALWESRLDYNEEWFSSVLDAHAALAFAKAGSLIDSDTLQPATELTNALIGGLVNNLVTAAILRVIGAGAVDNPETRDSLLQDFSDAVHEALNAATSKWSAYFAESSAKNPKGTPKRA
jgi:hypothetical protein